MNKQCKYLASATFHGISNSFPAQVSLEPKLELYRLILVSEFHLIENLALGFQNFCDMLIGDISGVGGY